MHKIEYETEELTPLERAEIHTDKVIDYQKKYNVSQKKIAYIIGKNLTLFVCTMIPILLVSSIWTDFGVMVLDWKMFSDAVLTVSLFTFGELMMIKLGSEGGRLDSEFINAKDEYEDLRSKCGDIGTLLMGVFCDWQIDVEMEQAVRFRLRMLRLTPKMWEEIKKLPEEELKARYGVNRARKMVEIINLKPIELNEAILLYNGEATSRGGVPAGGNTYLKNKWRIIETLVACIFTGLLTINVFLTLTDDITIARVIYTAFKLITLLFRMCSGYDKGARAYNTIEVRHLKAKSNYLKQYIKFVEDKLYLKLGDKYGDISEFVAEEI